MSLIKLSHVKKEFSSKKGTITAVNDVSFNVAKGEIFGFVGYSGAGKSTLIRLLNGLETPTSGEVIVNNQNVTDLKGKALRDYRKKIGMVFQHFNLLWSRTVKDNILLPLEISGVPKAEREARAQELLELVGLEGRENAYPSQLSGGQKQRVGIARALANRPDILLCDEATSALDPQTTDEVLELLLDINRQLNLTIVLITHEMHVIRKICHQVAVMENGEIAESGDVLDVFQRPQKEVTKRFVQQEILSEEPQEETGFDYLVETYPQGAVVKLLFKGEKANDPVISKAIRNFDIDINVLQGKIQQTQDSSFGTLVVQILGADVEIASTIAFFESQSVGVEVINHE